MTAANDNKSRLISMNEAVREVPYSRTMIMNLAEVGEFPKPVKLGAKKIAFVRAEVEAWIDQRIAARAAA